MATQNKQNDLDVRFFRAFGFLLLRQFFDPELLSSEIDHALSRGLDRSSDLRRFDDISFQYVPMMTAETPASLALLDAAETVAVALLGGPVLPTRAKAVRYVGNSAWHVDSESPIASIGFAAYFETLDADNGALRVLPGSHHPDFGNSVRKSGGIGKSALALPSHVLATQPGDLIVFDEHLFHASFAGGIRRQWRADYVRVPTTPEERAQTRAYFEGIYPADWDGGYDVDRYPSYGLDWRKSSRSSVATLDALGVYIMAARQEAFTRSKRP
jgi:hypothetical protein